MSFVEYTIGIVALDLDPAHGRGTKFFTAECRKNNTSWQKFVERCNALLESTAHVSHAELVWAAVCYCTMINKTSAEGKEYAKILYAFMGEEFDLSALGTWHECYSQSSFNEEEDLERVLVWTYNYPTSET